MAEWKNRWPFRAIGLVVFLMAACSDSPKNAEASFADCRYKAPQAIFSPRMKQVARHSFELDGQQGQEIVEFHNGLRLVLSQSGCDFIHQEFQFEWKSPTGDHPDAFWAKQVAGHFNYLGQLGPEYLSFQSLSEAIWDRAPQLKLQQKTELQPGFYLQIDKLKFQGRTILTASLSENEN